MEFFHDIKSDDEKSPLAAAAAKAAARAATKAKADAAIEGAGPPRSGPPSSAGIAAPSADDLRMELFAVYRPDPEPLGQFLSRIGRLVLALKAHKISVAASDLEKTQPEGHHAE